MYSKDAIEDFIGDPSFISVKGTSSSPSSKKLLLVIRTNCI